MSEIKKKTTQQNRREDSFQVSTLSSWAVSAFIEGKVTEEEEQV